MKKVFLFIALTISTTIIYGQKSIDALFERYAGKDGFVTITISGNLLKLATCLDNDNDDNSLPAEITEIRILAQEDENLKVENFYDMVINDINLDNYEEFMRVKESDQDLRMLVRSENNRFKEFLLIAGGEDNALIQIKGNMTYSEAKKFSSNARKNHGLNIVAKNK
ncbi:MAG: DUF4252 domain-containing protein [Bacteroidia bacterium]|nr:DUF4252 domain-containing protein [Bacteroidia bacterium]